MVGSDFRYRPLSVTSVGMNAKPPPPDDLRVKIPADAPAAILSPVDSFERRIAALEARLNRNSSNSSKPPSTEPLHVKRQPPGPVSKRRRGGQVGPERHTRELVPPERLTSTVEIKPHACSGCGHPLDGQAPSRPAIRSPWRHGAGR